ncbi:MAG: transposase, partial [Gemmatimonadota bacterium]
METGGDSTTGTHSGFSRQGFRAPRGVGAWLLVQVHGDAKSRYRIGHWPEYEAGLRRRGDLTVWLSEDAIDSWREPPSGKPGGQRTYANIAIEAALTIRMIFHLPLRQTEGFLRSLARILEVDLPIPDHTTLSPRLKKLGDIPFRAAVNKQPIHLLIDSTGLRIHIGHPLHPRAWSARVAQT